MYAFHRLISRPNFAWWFTYGAATLAGLLFFSVDSFVGGGSRTVSSGMPSSPVPSAKMGRLPDLDLHSIWLVVCQWDCIFYLH